MGFVPWESLNRTGIHIFTAVANLSLVAIPVFLVILEALVLGRKWHSSLRSAIALSGFLILVVSVFLFPLLENIDWPSWSLPWSNWLQIGQESAPMPLLSTHARLGTEPHWMTWGTLIWIGGVIVSILPFLVGKTLLLFLKRSATPLVFENWQAFLQKNHVRRRVLLATSPDCPVPLTWKSFGPVILLPAALKEANWEELEPILLHELAHIRRWDNLRLGFTRLVCSFFWFHPLVWIGGKTLRLETEKACDAQVVAAGHNHFSYAEQLVLLAQKFSGKEPGSAQALTAEKSSLGRRVAFLLSLHREEKRTSGTQLVLFILASVVACFALTGLQPVAVWEAKWLILKDVKYSNLYHQGLFVQDLDPKTLRSLRDLPVAWPVAVKFSWQSKDIIFDYPYKPFLSEALVKGPSDFPVVAAGDGVVSKVDFQKSVVQIQHSFGLASNYMDFRISPSLVEGQSILLGQVLGFLRNQTVGYSMNWNGAKLARDAWPNFAGNKLFFRYRPEE